MLSNNNIEKLKNNSFSIIDKFVLILVSGLFILNNGIYSAVIYQAYLLSAWKL